MQRKRIGTEFARRFDQGVNDFQPYSQDNTYPVPLVYGADFHGHTSPFKEGYRDCKNVDGIILFAAGLAHFNAPVDQALDGSSVNEVFLDNDRNIFGLYFRVPNTFGVNDDCRPAGMVPRAAGASYQNFFRQLPAIYLIAKALENF